ncbi:MAG: hypothetical protein WCC87_05900 [Candidatus Korobacteraceae bacterium]
MEIPVKIMKKKQNELNARDAFITILKSLTDIEYVESESPDEVNRNTPAVDFVLVSSSDENDNIAVEHTRVESFDEQIEYVNRWHNIVDSVRAGCRNQIPPDRYYFLAVPPIIVDSLVRKRSRELFVSNLSSWVVKSAPKLIKVDSYIQTEYERRKITLACSGNTACLNGNVWCIPEEPEEPESSTTRKT